MPRLYPDHRRTIPRRLRQVYEDIATRFPLTDGVARRLAVLAARAWIDYEALSGEIAALSNGRGRRKAAPMITRLRRRQAAYAGQFLGGLRSLEASCSRLERPPTLEEALAEMSGAKR